MSGPNMKILLIFLLNTSKLQECYPNNCCSLALKSIPAQKLKSETGLDGLYWKAPLICATLCGANNFWLQKQQLRIDCGHRERILDNIHQRNMTIFSSQDRRTRCSSTIHEQKVEESRSIFCIFLFRMVLFTDWSIEKYYLKYVTITNL